MSEMDSKLPKILIFSNNCFSKTNSNGRTLAKLLECYPKNNIAQFYIQNGVPDFERCDNYFFLSDSEALSAFIKNKPIGRCITQIGFEQQSTQSNSTKKVSKRNPLSMLLRELIWKSNRWKGPNFNSWVEEFSPDIILIQAGDNAFLLKIATDIAKERNIPLMIYNTEGYYFKKRNYMKNSGLSTIFYPLFSCQFKKQFKKTMEYASYAIYNCDMLKEDYDSIFACPSCVVYNSSDIEVAYDKNKIKSTPPIVSYLGNLGVGRHKALIEIANVLQKINPSIKLNIYGKLPTEEIRNELINCTGISYNGFVSYDEVISIMKNSDILVHAENFSSFYREDLKYAFSTKIADCLRSGTCFLNYAPKELASTQYLIENNAACVVTDKENLEDALRKLINDVELRGYYTNNALRLSEKNHDTKNNGMYILELVKKVAYEGIAS